MPRFHIINFGCRANQADGAVLQEELSRRGFEPATGHAQADIVVLNSCTVTAAADYGVRQAARRVHRENPAARILVTGCYAQRSPEALAALPGVEYVVGNSHKTGITRLLSQGLPPAAGPQTIELSAAGLAAGVRRHIALGRSGRDCSGQRCRVAQEGERRSADPSEGHDLCSAHRTGVRPVPQRRSRRGDYVV